MVCDALTYPSPGPGRVVTVVRLDHSDHLDTAKPEDYNGLSG